jgi:hypothetical protein
MFDAKYFPQFLAANIDTVPQNRPRPPPLELLWSTYSHFMFGVSER